jgi:hypothetical protein
VIVSPFEAPAVWLLEPASVSWVAGPAVMLNDALVAAVSVPSVALSV